MKRFLTIFLLPLITGFLFSFNPEPGPAQIFPEDTGFGKGEILVYRVHYSFFNAGEATITIDENFHRISNKDCYRVNVFGKSIGVFASILRIRDTWRTYMDKETLLPEKFYRSIEEGKYVIRETAFYHRETDTVRVIRRNKEGKLDWDKNFRTEENAHDIISGFYAMRAMDFDKFYIGYKFPMTAFFEDSTYTLQIKYLGTERIKTKFGKMNTHVFTPLMPGNELFEEGENTIKVYFTANEAKVPVKIRAEMFVGAVECDLKDYANVKGSLN